LDAGSDKRRLRRYRDHKQVTMAQNGLGRFFGRADISSITTDKIREYLRFAADNSKNGKLSAGTQKSHLAALRGILTFAFERRMIGAVPLMPKVKQVDNPRPWFTAQEYRLLGIVAFAFARRSWKIRDSEAAARWREIGDFVTFMVNSFLRPSEWAGLRQKNVEIVAGEHPHLKITVIEGKTRPRVVRTMPGAIKVYNRIISRSGSDPEQFLFKSQYRNRETAMAKMRESFDTLLDEAGLTFDGFGRKRVMYSLRHTALMLRVLQGDHVNLLSLAMNAGTSVEQLERFYCSHLDPEMMIENLQSFKGRAPTGSDIGPAGR